MRQPDYSGQFKRDVKQAQKRGKDMDKLKTLLGLLIEGRPLERAKFPKNLGMALCYPQQGLGRA